MKVQTPSRSEPIPTPEAVRELEALDAAETAEEILAAMPDIPVCVKCGKKAAEVNADGECCVCSPLKVRVVEATDENLAKAEASLPKVEQRPSLEVESEVHANLMPRLHSHLTRMRAWDLRSLAPESALRFRGAIADLETDFARVSAELACLHADGFVAKTTPVSRIASKLIPGASVGLREDKRAEFAKVYSAEQLDSLVVAKVVGEHVQLAVRGGESIGLVKVIHVEVR